MGEADASRIPNGARQGGEKLGAADGEKKRIVPHHRHRYPQRTREALGVTKIYSILGMLPPQTALLHHRPFLPPMLGTRMWEGAGGVVPTDAV